MDVLLIRAFALLGLAILVALAARRLRLPYTVGLALAGAALAAFRVNAGLALTHDLIFDVVLPPLLFEAALNLRWSELKRDLAPVIALSTVGVALSACVVAGGMHAWLRWPIKSALVFGALIAATDPIAVIALLRESAITGRLRLLIEAESLVNDGAAAVLFTLILAWAGRDPSAAGGPLTVASAFAVIAGGGLLVGLLVGLAAVALAGASDDHLVETALSAIAAFGSFLIAERLHASGVLATVAAGIAMGNLGVLGPKEGPGVTLDSARAHVRARILGIRGLPRQLAGVPLDRIGDGDHRFRPRGLAGAGACHPARAGWARGRRLPDLPCLLGLALGRAAEPAASPMVGRIARRACAGAGARAASGSALSGGHPHRRFRGRGVFGHRPGTDRAAGAAVARTRAEQGGRKAVESKPYRHPARMFSREARSEPAVLAPSVTTDTFKR